MKRRSQHGIPQPPAHCALLLRALCVPAALAHLGPSEWDLLVRVARRARLHGVLHARCAAAGVLEHVPERAAAHLESGAAVARYQLQLVRLEQHHLAQTLAPLGVPLVLLKGAAYAAQEYGFAEGRPLSDLDLMVPAGELARVEAALRRAGWRSESKDPYDERYYREWSHEIPPLVGPGRHLEVDLHHTILPPTARMKPDAARLLADSVPSKLEPFRVLSAADQVLHAAVNLVQDVDTAERLRDLVDMDGLLRTHGGHARLWTELLEHAALHGLGRPLWYAVRLAQAWFGTPLDPAFERALDVWRPATPVRRFTSALFAAALFPIHPDRGRTLAQRGAWQLLRLRAMWQRMPAVLLLRHGLHKLASRADRRPTLAPK